MHDLVDIKTLKVVVKLNRSIEECVSKCKKCGRLFRVVRCYENSKLVKEEVFDDASVCNCDDEGLKDELAQD